MSRRRRWLLIGLAAVVAMPLAAVAVFVATFDAAAWTPRLTAAVEAATGRRLDIAGPVSARLSLLPTLTLEGVSLANAPGGSRAAMLTLRRAEVQFAVLPLLSRRIELRRVVLDGADLLLETAADGTPNWTFSRADAAVTTAPAAPAAPAGRSPPLGLAVDVLRLRDGTISWRDPRTGRTTPVAVERLALTAADAAVSLDARLALAGTTVDAAGEVGDLGALVGGNAAWPFRIALTTAGARGTATGQRDAAGTWAATVTAQVAEPERFLAAPLPAFDLALTLGVEGGAATLGALRLTAGAADLSKFRPGLRLTRLEARRDAAGGPLAVQAEGALEALPLQLVATLGPLERLGAGAGVPWPVDVALGAGSAAARVRGTLTDPRNLTGVNATVALRIPALAQLSPWLGSALPPVAELSLDAQLRVPAPGISEVRLDGLRLTSSAGDLSGTLGMARGDRPRVTGTLASRRLDLGALQPAATALDPPAAPATRASTVGRVLPLVALPTLGPLAWLDGGLRWTAAELVIAGTTLREVAADIALNSGRLQLDPVVALVPGGRVTLRLAADGTVAPAAVQVAAVGTGLDLAPLLAGLGLPARADGRLDLDADLRGTGADTRALAATLTGHLGLAVTAGHLDSTLLAALPGELRRLLPGGEGPIVLRCAALRAEAAAGIARLSTLLLDSAVGRLGGQGAIQLGDESLALRLLPDLRVAGFALRAPIAVGGTLAAPRVGVAPESALAGGLGAFLSLQRSPDPALSGLAGVLGGGAPGLPDCGAALAAARGGRAGPVPARAPDPATPGAPTTPPGGPRGLPPGADALLRGLLGK